MHDDGQAGDLLAGDQYYTLQVTFDEPLPAQIQIQVTAALSGQLRRPVSLTMALTISVPPADLPPDPGAPGMTTLAGIDSDHDGVRDDVQRAIALTFPQPSTARSIITQAAISLQAFILDGSTGGTSTPGQAAND
jgi:hypothetical protein